MKAYKEILLKGKDIQSRLGEEGVIISGNQLIIQTLPEEKESWSYKNPIIPEGYTYVGGEWNKGFTIRDAKGNLWVWVPVGILPENGVFDGESSRFGRRNFHEFEPGFASDTFSNNKFHEEVSEELMKQKESVEKYGGFYVSKYLISKTKKNKPRSIQGVMPCNNINWYDAMELAKKLGNKGSTEAHLIYGSEYDSVCQWFITSKAKTYEEVVRNSTSWGNYWNSENSEHEVTKTGVSPKYYANGIADFAGNLWSWTQEHYGDSRFCVRGGSCSNDGNNIPVVFRYYFSPIDFYNDVGLRAALYVK